MKKTIINTILTTGISIIGLTFYFTFSKENHILLKTLIELFGANVLIHLGLHIKYKYEFRNVILDYIIDITYVLIVLVLFGVFCGWFSAVPVWILISSGIVIYIITSILTVSKIRKDSKEINELLEKIQE